MTFIIYLSCILGVLGVVSVLYQLVVKYATLYLVIIVLGCGIVVAQLILKKDLSILMGVLAVGGIGVIASILTIPALLLTKLEVLEDDVKALKKATKITSEECEDVEELP